MLSNTTTNSSISFLKNDFLVWFLCVAYSCFFSVMSAFSQKKEKKKCTKEIHAFYLFKNCHTKIFHAFLPFQKSIYLLIIQSICGFYCFS